jgi:hypothetical protein
VQHGHAPTYLTGKRVELIRISTTHAAILCAIATHAQTRNWVAQAKSSADLKFHVIQV